MDCAWLGKKVGVYRRPDEGKYLEMHVVEMNDVVACSSVPEVRFPVAELPLSHSSAAMDYILSHQPVSYLTGPGW